jgi:hypothetical protein
MDSSRSTFRAGIVCGALLAMFVCTSAWADDSQNPSAPVAKSGDSNKVICKREKVTGSNIPKRVCRTQEQIDKEQAASKEFGEHVRDSSWNAPSSSVVGQ